MKVPVYRAQTARTNKIGGVPFSVQANPGALSADTQALTQLAQTGLNESLRWTEKIVSTRRQSELAATEAKYKSTLADAKIQSLTEDPKSLMFGTDTTKSFEERMRDEMDQIARGITDSVVRKRFKTRAEDNLLSTRISVFQDARNREIDSALTNYTSLEEGLIKDITSGNNAERAAATLRLFGGFDANGAPVVSIYREMAENGLLKDSDIFKRELRTRQRIAGSEVQNRLSAADRSGDPNETLRLQRDLRNNKNFKYLTPEKRDAFTKQVVNLVQQQQRQVLVAQERKERNAEKQVKKNRQVNFANLVARTLEFQTNPEDPKAIANKPTPLEISNLIANGGLTPENGQQLIKLIRDEDAIDEDADLVRETNSALLAAVDPEEIDEILEGVRDEVGTTLKSKTFISLEKFGNTLKAKTPLIKDIKKYEGYVKRLIGDHEGTTLTFGGAAKTVDLRNDQRKLDAIDTYTRLVTDADDPIDPREAFIQVRDQYLASVKAEIDFLAPAPFLSTYFKGAKPATWTREMVDNARLAITQNRNLTQLQRMLEHETLDQIINLIPSDPPPNLGENKNSDQSDDSGVLKSFLNFFSPEKPQSQKLRERLQNRN